MLSLTLEVFVHRLQPLHPDDLLLNEVALDCQPHEHAVVMATELLVQPCMPV